MSNNAQDADLTMCSQSDEINRLHVLVERLKLLSIAQGSLIRILKEQNAALNRMVIVRARREFDVPPDDPYDGSEWTGGKQP